MKRLVPLERAAEEVCNMSSKPPLIFQLPPERGREVLDNLQDTPVYKYPAEVATITVNTGKWGDVELHRIQPENISHDCNTIFYIHGAGWVFGNLHTHDKLVRELAARTNSVVIFPEYSLSPEAKYPTAIEQCYEILCRLPEISSKYSWDLKLDKLTVAGDSVGGNMATVMTIMSKFRNGPKIHKQLLYYPVTNAYFNTQSYNEFAFNYYLYRCGMIWFWNQYTSCMRDRDQITASPLRASINQLSGLPQAMIINGQADVLRDEGEAYATKLRLAGVSVTQIRIQAIIHDFVMLNVLNQTNGCRTAMDASTSWINRKNREK